MDDNLVASETHQLVPMNSFEQLNESRLTKFSSISTILKQD